MLLLALALAHAGFAALCCAMERHHAELLGTRRVPPGRARALRLAGTLLLALSVGPCIALRGWGMGVVLWCGVLSAAVLPLVLLLPYAPRLAAWLAVALPPTALLLLAFRV